MTTPTKVLDLRGLSATERDDAVNAAVSEACGVVCYAEKRGDYTLAIVTDGKKVPWSHWNVAKADEDKKRYTKISCAEAARLGFFGQGFERYATSCDAVRVLEMALPKEQRNRYINLLNDIHAEEEIDAVELDFRWCTSSALDRCIALLRANGWEILT